MFSLLTHLFSGKTDRIPEAVYWGTVLTTLIAVFTIKPHSLFQHHSYFILFMQALLVCQWLISLCISLMFFRHYRIMEDTPTSKIRSCAQGYVELEGQQYNFDQKPLLSPLGKQSCTWYHYKIEKLIYQNRKPYWKTIQEETSSNPFVLDDKTGQCLVLPQGAKVLNPKKMIWRGHSILPSSYPKNRLVRYLFHNWGQYRYHEMIMLPNSDLYAIGMFETTDKVNMLSIKNLPKRRPYILSMLSEEKLISKYKFKAVIYFMTFIILFIGQLYFKTWYNEYWHWLLTLLSR